jgi:hypothetical protein
VNLHVNMQQVVHPCERKVDGSPMVFVPNLGYLYFLCCRLPALLKYSIELAKYYTSE